MTALILALVAVAEHVTQRPLHNFTTAVSFFLAAIFDCSILLNLARLT